MKYFFFILAIVVASELIFAQPFIRRITFDRQNVFSEADSSTPGWIRSSVNALHVKTNESLLRKEIVIQEGDSLRPLALEESERKLRQLHFLGDVIVRSELYGDSCDVMVHTQDKWSFTPNASFKRDGGFQTYGLSLSESNLLGMGYSLLGSADYSTERKRPLGVSCFFIGKHLPFHSYEIMVQYKNAEELTVRSLSLSRPFFSEDSRWAGGVYVHDEISLRRLYKNSLIVQQEQVSVQEQMAWGMLSTGSTTKYRFGTAWIRRMTDGATQLVENDDHMNSVRISLGILVRTWEKEISLNTLTRTEDVPYGFAADILLGKNFANQTNQLVPDYWTVRGIGAMAIGKRTYIAPSVYYVRMASLGGDREATLHYSILAHHRLSSKDFFMWRVDGVMGYRWPVGKELNLGETNGLRGYSKYELAGNRALLLNLESRRVFDASFWIFQFGAAVFLDCGTVWKESDEFLHQRFYSSVGFGLRIENNKQQGNGIIRVDFPYSLYRHRISGIIITSTHFLNAFENLDSLLPFY